MNKIDLLNKLLEKSPPDQPDPFQYPTEEQRRAEEAAYRIKEAKIRALTKELKIITMRWGSDVNFGEPGLFQFVIYETDWRYCEYPARVFYLHGEPEQILRYMIPHFRKQGKVLRVGITTYEIPRPHIYDLTKGDLPFSE